MIMHCTEVTNDRNIGLIIMLKVLIHDTYGTCFRYISAT